MTLWIYTSVVRPMLIHGAVVWWTRTVTRAITGRLLKGGPLFFPRHSGNYQKLCEEVEVDTILGLPSDTMTPRYDFS